MVLSAMNYLINISTYIFQSIYLLKHCLFFKYYFQKQILAGTFLPFWLLWHVMYVTLTKIYWLRKQIVHLFCIDSLNCSASFSINNKIKIQYKSFYEFIRDKGVFLSIGLWLAYILVYVTRIWQKIQ
jgi:hypothetical protein